MLKYSNDKMNKIIDHRLLQDCDIKVNSIERSH